MRYTDTRVVDLLRKHVPEATRTDLARTLALMRRQKPQRPDTRKFTGRIHGRRRPVGTLLVLPGGSIGVLKEARGKHLSIQTLMIEARNREPIDLVAHESDVRLVAAALGSLKRGVKERPSAVKAAAAKRNCNLPPKPGKHPRGRPRKHMTHRNPHHQRILLKILMAGASRAERLMLKERIASMDRAVTPAQ